jgi:DNA-directed RNA polymerase subunit RPC12/RpoP
MKLYKCQKCGAEVKLPDEVSPQFKIEVRRVAERSRIEAIRYLRDNSPLDLAQSKAVSFHLSNMNDGCHRCGTKLPGGEEVFVRSVSLSILTGEG